MSSERYDTIIVGAGSAGCVLANRLSADPARRVLLLEAGPRDRHWRIHVPPGFVRLFKGKLDWAIETEPEPHLHGRRLYWPRGKVVGGSSSINAQLYIRGHRRDYDRWRDLGNDGWGWDDVLPYFKRSEDQQRGASKYHGKGGPLAVSDPRYTNPLSDLFVDAGVEFGLPACPDLTVPEPLGVGRYQVNPRDGRRCSAAVGFLRPVLERQNLTVFTDCPVRQVVIENGRAVGVEAVLQGNLRRLEADQIILSGGAVHSPQLLMLSGVGPADHLEQHGVEVVADLPGVGRNLQDHAVVSVVYRSHSSKTLDTAENLGNLLRYLISRKGPFNTSVCEAGGFVETRHGLEQPDLQFHFIPGALIDHGFDSATDHGFNFGPTLLKPLSRGMIDLRSADPTAPPRVRANYLEHEQDLRTLVEGVRLARRLAATDAFASEVDHEVLPGPDVDSDEQLADFVRRTAETIYHPVGTCRMGHHDDGLATPPVVDDRLRVYGVEGLRVVDASVMPEIIGGNTNAPTIMIAEKAADMIAAEG